MLGEIPSRTQLCRHKSHEPPPDSKPPSELVQTSMISDATSRDRRVNHTGGGR